MLGVAVHFCHSACTIFLVSSSIRAKAKIGTLALERRNTLTMRINVHLEEVTPFAKNRKYSGGLNRGHVTIVHGQWRMLKRHISNSVTL
jgi:hypothetical protein